MPYTLLGPGGPYASDVPGSLGGNGAAGLYGRLDCSSARRALARGATYARRRVFFADEEAAVACGFRPCARCLPAEYAAWKARRT